MKKPSPARLAFKHQARKNRVIKNTNPERDARIDDCHKILASFDFERVHTAMVVLGWHWADDEDAPSVEELKAVATCLLIDNAADARENVSTHCGGFVARRYGRRVFLAFELTTAGDRCA